MRIRIRIRIGNPAHNYKKINGKKELSNNSFKGLSQRLKM
jgi:hypothetical protein